MSDKASAYSVLKGLAKQSLSHAQQLPAQVDTIEQWSGIGFSLLGFDFVTSMDELSEMLEVPPYTRLPGVHSWVKGVANIRGRLLPLFDLAAFYSGALSGQKKHQRLLVLDNASIYAGLWVDRVLGMQYFSADTRMDTLPDGLPEPLMPCVDGCFELNARTWTVFHPLRLLEQERFLNIAAG